MTVQVRILLHGLLLFVPEKAGSDRSLSIILPEARNPPISSDGCPLHQHLPLLLYNPSPLAAQAPFEACPRELCSYQFGMCHCELDSVVVDLTQLPAGLNPDCTQHRCDTKDLKAALPELPVKRFSTRNEVRWEARFPEDRPSANKGRNSLNKKAKALGYTLEEWNRRAEKLVAAKISTPTLNAFRVCSYFDEGVDFEFEPLGEDPCFPYAAPLPEVELAEFAVEVPGPWLELRLVAFDGTSITRLKVPVARCNPDDSDSPYCADLIVANMMVEQLGSVERGRCSQDLIGRDFELYHDLLEDPGTLVDRRVPVRPKAKSKESEARNAQAAGCQHTLFDQLHDLRRQPSTTIYCSGGSGKGSGP